MATHFISRVATFLGQPIRLPGWLLMLLGAYSFIPDNAARLEFWMGLHMPPVIATALSSPWAGVALVALGVTYLWFFRGVVHVHHGDLSTSTTPVASLSLRVARAGDVNIVGGNFRAGDGGIGSKGGDLSIKGGDAVIPSPPPTEPDEWVQNAVRLIVWGQWRVSIDGASNESEATSILQKTGKCLARIRELAYAGKLHVWGRTDPNRLDESIPREYWADHQIDILATLDGRGEERVETEPAVVHGASRIVYTHLRVSAAEFERMWFVPLADAAIQAYEDTRGSLSSQAAEISWSDGTNNVLSWYAYAIIGKTFDAVSLYGKRPPSRKLERIAVSTVPSSAISDDATELLEKVSGKARFTGLCIPIDDLKPRISEIQNWG